MLVNFLFTSLVVLSKTPALSHILQICIYNDRKIYRQPIVKNTKAFINFLLHADDTQLYQPCRFVNVTGTSFVSSTSARTFDVNMWMNSSRLKLNGEKSLNDDKTHFIIIGSNTKKLPQPTNSITGHKLIFL